MSEKNSFDLVIIGGGPAGYAAAIYAARASLATMVLEQGMPGGQIATTDDVENYPGIPHISGSELGMKFQEHAESLGAVTEYAMITSVQRNEDGSFDIAGDTETYHASALIVATGAVPCSAGFTGEDKFRGRGVSYCATCDGMFYRGKHVFVIGGGNAACEEGLFLTNFADQVTMVVRRNVFRAPQGVVDRLLANEKIDVRYATSIVSVDGDAALSSITFRDNATGEVHEETFDEGSIGIFVFAGTQPVTDLVGEFVDLSASGGVITDEDMATRTPGLFAAGDVRDKRLRQVITAAADGAIAATSAYRYLRES